MKKYLSLFTLVMINVMAIDNLRGLTFGAKFGLSLVSYYLLAALLFFVPVALVSAECATGWPKQGGIYVWVREAFGSRWAFFVIWIIWIYNVVWFPTQMVYVVMTLAQWFWPQSSLSVVWLLLSTNVFFWFCTWLNRYGSAFSGWVSTMGVLLGTFFPMLVLVGIGVVWLIYVPAHTLTFSWSALLPSQDQADVLPYLVEVVFGLVGIEMSAMHANDVENPQSTFPRAVWISSLLIVGSMLAASLAIAVVIPSEELQLVTGVVQVFQYALQGPWQVLLPFLVLMVAWSGAASVATWIIGPSKGMLVAAREGILPRFFAKTNEHEVPERILWLQCVLFFFLSLVYCYFSLEVAYTLLLAMTTQLALMVYVVMFLAVVRLRYRYPKQATFQVPGGMLGLVSVALVGILSCLGMIVLGFVQPEVPQGMQGWDYTLTLMVGVSLLAACPFLWYAMRQIDGQRA